MYEYRMTVTRVVDDPGQPQGQPERDIAAKIDGSVQGVSTRRRQTARLDSARTSRACPWSCAGSLVRALAHLLATSSPVIRRVLTTHNAC